MISNNVITYYHKVFNKVTKEEEWERFVFNNVWVFTNKGSNVNKGYENSNSVNIRIPIQEITNNNFSNIFSIGDIVVVGIESDISKQSDLNGKDFYNIISININNFGNNPHIHLGGR